MYNLLKRFSDNKKNNINIIEEYNEEDRTYIKKVLNLMKKIGLIDYRVSNIIKHVDFSITSMCNLECKHCSNSIMECIPEPSFNKIIQTMNVLFYANVTDLTITGGEPLIRKDFCNIVDYARNKCSFLRLMTNGTLITSKNIRFICNNFDSISISLDGFNEKSCDLIRGKGTYKKVINAIDLLRSYNYRNIDLSSVENNYNDIDKFYLLCEKLQVKPIVRKYAPAGRGEKNARELFSEMLDADCEEKKALATYIQEKGINYGYGEDSVTVCSAYEQSVYVGADLYIYPCGALNLSEFKGDNILEIQDLKKYFLEKEYMRTEGYRLYDGIKPGNSKYCDNCSVSIFCNDCPAYLYLYYKNGYFSAYCEECKEYMRGKIYG